MTRHAIDTVSRCARGTSDRSTSVSSASAATTSAAGSTRRQRAPWSTPRSTPASRSSTPPTSTATTAGAKSCSAARFADAATTSCSRRSSARRWGTARSGAARGLHPRSARGVAAPTPDRGRRPLPASRGGHRDAARGDDRRARRARRRRQDPRLRHVELPGRDPRARQGDRVGRVRLGAERVLVAAPRGRGRGAARLRTARARLHPVLPARERPAHRQGLARRSAGRGHASARPDDRRRRARPRRAVGGLGAKPTACRCSTSRSAVSLRSRRSRR